MTGTAAQDDPTIDDGDRLLRRIHPDHLVYDENQQRWRASSAAFEDVYDGVSVYLGSGLAELDMGEAQVLDGFEQHSLVVFTAGAVRAMDPPLGVVRDPDPPGVPPHIASPAHALVTGIPNNQFGRKKIRKPLAARVATEFVVLREKSA